MKFGIMRSPLTKRINVGRINKAETEFLEKQDMTNEALYAVIQHVMDTEHGAIDLKVGDRTFHIEAVELTKE